MPLSSSSGPSFGGSNPADIFAPSAARFDCVSASVRPNVAGCSRRKRRPKRPWNIGDRFVDINPRTGSPCRPLLVTSDTPHWFVDERVGCYPSVERGFAQPSRNDDAGYAVPKTFLGASLVRGRYTRADS